MNSILLNFEESFKDSSKDFWNAGLFDYEIKIKYVTYEMLVKLADWLCDNCRENFVLFRITTEIIAGGNINPKNDWEKKKLNLSKDNYIDHNYNDCSSDILIRLNRMDIIGFRLTWIL